MRPIVLMVSQREAQNPEVLTAANVVSIEHSPMDCHRCGTACWVGPRQKIMATLGGAEAICYGCFLKDPDLKGQIPVVSLNPTIDNVPRRLT
jgi:hypothetical protein